MPGIGLISREGSAPAARALRDAAEWLASRGQATVELTAADSPQGLDLVIAFGGDGTLLGAAHLAVAAANDLPVLGINLGHLGYLTEVGRADMVEALTAVLEGRTRRETRLLIRGTVERDGAVMASRLALNDIVLTRGALSRMIEVDVAVDDATVTHVKADGVIVATATGSTAYNLSAGGPIVLPTVDALVLTPIAPHALTYRPVVLPATARVTLRSTDLDRDDLVATFDGQFGVNLAPGDSVHVARAERPLTLLRVTSRSHFDVLRDKLRWG